MRERVARRIDVRDLAGQLLPLVFDLGQHLVDLAQERGIVSVDSVVRPASG